MVKTPAASSGNNMARKKRVAKAKPILELSADEMQQYMARRTQKADWVLTCCEWIRGARDTRLAAMTQWAQVNSDAELVVTHFLAMEADARMR